MTLPGFIEIPLRVGLMLAGLLLPGSMILRALRLPWSLAASFVISCASLYLAVVTFAWTGAPISSGTLALALGAVALAGRLVPARGAVGRSFAFDWCTNLGGWTPLYAAFWLVVGYRLLAQPLSGPDVYFRWSYLAEQMLRYASLDFYPPRSGEEFLRYFWAESIPPGVASLYGWAYACGGSRHALWTSPVVALQLLALHDVIWRLANRWGGEVVARRAVLLAAACPLLTWSFLIGQESGPTALAVCGLVWCLHHMPDESGDGWAILAGVFAVLASSTREYGPIFAGAAVAGAIIQGSSRRQTLLICLVSVPAAAAWPLRAWALTGNPVYSLSTGGVFPENAVFLDWLVAFRGPHQSVLATPEGWLTLGRYLVLWALPATAGLVALLVLLVRRQREAVIVATFTVLLVGLWRVYVSYSAGGLFYSVRVLGPALGLWVVVAAYAHGRYLRHPMAAKCGAVVVTLIMLESLPKTLVLPENPYRLPGREWLEAGRQFPALVRSGEQTLVTRLGALPGRERIVSDDAGMQRAFASIGTEVMPLWSPEIDWLFDRSLSAGEIARRWGESGIRYLVLGKSGPTADFMASRARWRAPYFNLRTVTETDTHLILEATVAPPDPAPGR